MNKENNEGNIDRLEMKIKELEKQIMKSKRGRRDEEYTENKSNDGNEFLDDLSQIDGNLMIQESLKSRKKKEVKEVKPIVQEEVKTKIKEDVIKTPESKKIEQKKEEPIKAEVKKEEPKEVEIIEIESDEEPHVRDEKFKELDDMMDDLYQVLDQSEEEESEPEQPVKYHTFKKKHENLEVASNNNSIIDIEEVEEQPSNSPVIKNGRRVITKLEEKVVVRCIKNTYRKRKRSNKKKFIKTRTKVTKHAVL